MDTPDIPPAPPTPEDPVDLEQFRLTDPYQIQRILRDLSRKGHLVTAHFNDGRDFILTALLGIDPKSGRMLLDVGPDEELNRLLLRAGEAVIVTNHNQARVQFRTDGIASYTFEDAPAFIANIPPSLIRIQRREFYRLSAPIGTPLQVHYEAPNGTALVARVADISIGGMGILEPPAEDHDDWEPGTILRGVRLELPGEEGLSVDMQVRNRFECDESGSHRVGCMFINLQNRYSAAIQRYIQRIELERRRIVHG